MAIFFDSQVTGSSSSTGSFGHLLVGGSELASSPDATDGSQSLISGSTGSTGSFGRIVLDGRQNPKINFKDNDISLGEDALLGTGNSHNVAIGYRAAMGSTSGYQVAIGYLALSGSGGANNHNVAIGTETLSINIDSNNYGNTAVGGYALQSGSYRYATAVGYAAAQNYDSTSPIVAIGYNAGKSVPDSNFVAIGSNALNTTGSAANSVAVGMNALQNNNTTNASVAVGDNALSKNTTGGFNIAVGRFALQDATTANSNIAIGGYGTLMETTTGGSNIAVGTQAMEKNLTGISNIAIGGNAMRYHTDSDYNVAIGPSAMQNVSVGTFNVALGYHAGYNTKGDNNVMIGQAAGYSSGPTTVDFNVFIGYYAGRLFVSGSDNVAVGKNAMYQAGKLGTNANDNVAVGDSALYNAGGLRNVGIGLSAMSQMTVGNDNVAVGYGAGQQLASGNRTSGSNSVYVGQLTKSGENNSSNEIVIGSNAIGKGTNTVVLGDDTITDIYLSEDVGATVYTGDNVVDGILTISQSSSGGDFHLEGLKIIRATIGTQYMRLTQQGGATHLVSYVEGGGTRGSINLMGHNAATGTPVSYLHLSQNSAGTGGIISGSAASTGSFGRFHVAEHMGIGTTTPNNAGFSTGYRVLTISGVSSDTAGVLELVNPNVASDHHLGQIRFQNLDGGSSVAASAQIHAERAGADDAAELRFSTTTGGSISENMVLDKDGNLGIGTTSPDAPLELTPGAVGTTSTIGGLSVNDGLKINTTSGRSGITVVTSNDFLDTSTNAAFQFLYPYDDSSSSNDKTYKAFRIAHGSDITGSGDSFSIDKFGNVITTGDISGSSTSTGSFGQGYFNARVGIDAVDPDVSTTALDQLVVGYPGVGGISTGTNHAGIVIGTGNTHIGRISFLDTPVSYGGAIDYHHAAGAGGVDTLSFYTDGYTRRLVLEGNKISGSSSSTGSFGQLETVGDLIVADATNGFKVDASVSGHTELKLNNRTIFVNDDIIAIGENVAPNDLAHQKGGGAGGRGSVYIGNEAGENVDNSGGGAANNTFIGNVAGQDVTSGTANTFVGAGAGSSVTTGTGNVIIGRSSNGETDIDNNIIIGQSAGTKVGANGGNADHNIVLGNGTVSSKGGNIDHNILMGYRTSKELGDDEGSYNVHIGYEAASNVVTASYNVAIGYQAMEDAGGASSGGNHVTKNIAIGYRPLVKIDENAQFNIAIGTEAANNNTTGSNNIVMGYRAAYNNSGDLGQHNIFMGTSTGNAINGGDFNVLLGKNAGAALTTANDNILIGQGAGFNQTTGNHIIALGKNAGRGSGVTADTNASSIFIGNAAYSTEAGATNETVIGHNAIGKGSNTVVLGDDNVTDIYLSEDKGATVYGGMFSGSFYQEFLHNFQDDLDTTGHFVPWVGNAESTGNNNANTAYLTPYDMTLQRIIIRPETLTGTDTFNVSIVKQDDGDTTNDTVATATSAGNHANDTAIVINQSDFNTTPSVGALDKVSIKILPASDLSGTIDWYITSIWKVDKIL